LQKKIIIVF